MFQLTPGTEAPAEMLIYFPQFRVLDMAEDVTHTMHNLYTLRGAEVRDGNLWSRYIGEALEALRRQDRRADRAAPLADRGAGDASLDLLKKQRDLYKFIHDQSLRLMNHGYTPAEIAETLRCRRAWRSEWSARGYYGTLSHNAKAVYQKYLGWYDANPANLNPLPPVESARKTVEYMGGADAVIARARADFARASTAGWRGDEPGRVRRSRQPRRARAGRRRAGAAGLSGRIRHLAQRLPGRCAASCATACPRSPASAPPTPTR